MKIALCISGLPRAIEEAYPFIRQAFFKDKYEIDIFAHTWMEDPYRNGSHEKYLSPELDYETRANEVMKILQLYKPKSFSIDSHHIRQEYYQANPDYIVYTRYCSMLESVYRANELKKKYEEQNHFTYDCVIRCRFDTGFLQSFNFEEYDLENHIYVMDVGKDPKEHLNDMFAFSSSKRMDRWCDLYLHIQEMAERVIAENEKLKEFYKRTRNGPDNHDLYACWNRTQNLGVVCIPVRAVHRCVEGKINFC